MATTTTKTMMMIIVVFKKKNYASLLPLAICFPSRAKCEN